MNNKVLGSVSLSDLRSVLFVLTLLALSGSVNAAADTGVSYIDFDSGNDSNPGKRDSPYEWGFNGS